MCARGTHIGEQARVLHCDRNLAGNLASDRNMSRRKHIRAIRSHSQDSQEISRSNQGHIHIRAHVGSWHWHIATGEMLWSDELYRILGAGPQREGASLAGYRARPTVLEVAGYLVYLLAAGWLFFGPRRATPLAATTRSRANVLS